ALLFPAVLLLATSLLAIFRAPTHFLWMVTVGVTEFGHYLAFICLGAAVVFAAFSGAGRAAAGISVIAGIVAFTPLIRATWIARDLPQQLHETFGDAVPSRSAPLVYSEMFSGLSLPQIKTERFKYSSIEGEDLSLDFYHAQSSHPAPL